MTLNKILETRGQCAQQIEVGLGLVEHGHGSLQYGTQRVAQLALPLVVFGNHDQLVRRALRNGAVEVVGGFERIARRECSDERERGKDLCDGFHSYSVCFVGYYEICRTNI